MFINELPNALNRVLLNDAKRLAEQTEKYGIPTILKVYDRVGHVFQFQLFVVMPRTPLWRYFYIDCVCLSMNCPMRSIESLDSLLVQALVVVFLLAV
jgi:hypothetical protein